MVYVMWRNQLSTPLPAVKVQKRVDAGILCEYISCTFLCTYRDLFYLFIIVFELIT
jgi:hypothetical protein